MLQKCIPAQSAPNLTRTEHIRFQGDVQESSGQNGTELTNFKENNMIPSKLNNFLHLKKIRFLVYGFLLLLLIPETSFAQILLDNIAGKYEAGAMKWQPIITEYAKSLFWHLAELDFIWTTIVWVKDRKEFGEVLASLTGKILSLLFFFSLLLMASDWMPAIINSFSQIGKNAATAAGANVGTLDSVLFTGIDLAKQMFMKLNDGVNPINVFERIVLSIFVFPSAIIVSIGFALVAGQLLVAMIESYIAIYGGIIMLGFGGSRWTSDMASSYLKFAVGTGVKLMLCYLVIGLGFNIFIAAVPTSLIEKDFFEYLITIIPMTSIYVYLVFSIPGLASGMLSGSPNMSLGGLAGAAITAGAGLAAAGAVAGSMGGKAGSMLGGAAAEAGGAGKALKAGFDQNRSTGMGFGESAMKAPVPGIKSAASMVGAKAVEAGKSLAEGGKGMLGKVGDAINNSAGGKVASNIVASGSAADSGADTPAQAAETTSTPNYDIPPGVRAAQADKPTSNNPTPGTNYDLSPSVRSAQAEKATSMPSSTSAPSSSNSAASGLSNSGPASSADNSGIPSPASSPVSSQVDASGASVGSSDPHTKLLESMNANLEAMANGPEQARKLHQKISSLRDFVPQDGATVQTSGISIGHTKD